MPAELSKIPGVERKRHGRRRTRPHELDDAWPSLPPMPAVVRDPRPVLGWTRRWIIAPRREIAWSVVAITVLCVALGLYILHAAWKATRVHVTAHGVESGLIVQSRALAGQDMRFTINPTRVLRRATLTVDGAAIDYDDLEWDASSLVWRAGRFAEGTHEVALTVPRPLLAPATFRWRFTVDDTPPRIDVPSVVDPVGVCDPVAVRGEVERGAALTLDGKPLAHDGSFTLRYDRPPAAPLHLAATDAAGNETRREVVFPVRYPGGQGVHMTAVAWAYEPLKRPLMAMIEAGKISAVELDLKDEAGVVGYDSKVPFAHQIGAVQPEYRLKEAVAELKARGVRVIGRIVMFRDPVLAKWAWNNGRKDMVVQTTDGAMLSSYGGFANPVHPDVHRYNLDLALEATAGGVDDIMWDYIRRPEGDPATMVMPGLQGAPADGIVQFLRTSHAALRERCAYQGAAVFGIAADRPDAVAQDIPRMSRHVDYLAPMLYPSHWVPGEYGVDNPDSQPYDIVKVVLADFQEKMAGTGRALVPWLQDFSLKHPYGPAEVRAQIRATADAGVADWLLWNAGATYTADALDPAWVRLRR